MTLARYLLLCFARALVGVFAVIAIVFTLFTSVENLRRLGGTNAATSDVVRISLLELPQSLYQVFPLVLMLASLVTFLRLARSSELVVMRAAGLSALSLIGVPVTASVLIGAAAVAAVNPFVAAATKRSIAIEDGFRNPGASLLSFSSEGLWLRQADGDGQAVIQAARASADGTILSRVHMHRFDGGGRLYARIDAQAARLNPGSWTFEDATVREARSDGTFGIVSEGARYDVPTNLTSAEILESFSPPEMVGFWALGTFISRMEDSGFSGLRHRLFLQTELAKPVLFAAMVLIGAAFALRPTRFGQTGVMILLAVLAGFALYFIKDFSESLAAQGQIPLLAAAWTPPVAAILLAVSLLLHLEDG